MAGTLIRVMLYALPSWVLLFISVEDCYPSMPQVAVFSIAAVLTTTWLYYGLWRILYLRPFEVDRLQFIKVYNIIGFLAAVAFLAMAFSYLTGSRHDYMACLKQWEVILGGNDPWLGTDNAYGPIHNLLAWTYKIHRLLPKVLFSFLLVATGAISSFVPLGIEDRTHPLERCCLFASFILSPFSLITVSLYANNDILPAAAMVLALIGIVSFKSISSRILSGGILALGFMSKFYPLIIFLSLSIRRRCIDWAFIGGFLGTLILVASFAYKLWGNSFLVPILFAGSRGSKHLSIFNFTRNVMGLNLDGFSIRLMVVAFAVMSYFQFKKNIGSVLGSILTFAAVLTFYKVGHQQFFLFFFLVAPFAIRYLLSCSNILTPRVAATFFVWIGFLNWYQLEYSLTCGMWEGPSKVFRYGGALFRYWGALFYLIISTFLAVTIIGRINARDVMLADSTDSAT
jgi:hypothetical protein